MGSAEKEKESRQKGGGLGCIPLEQTPSGPLHWRLESSLSQQQRNIAHQQCKTAKYYLQHGDPTKLFHELEIQILNCPEYCEEERPLVIMLLNHQLRYSNVRHWGPLDQHFSI